MKSEILRILQMQADGKLTQDQAAQLLSILADQAREQPGVSAPPNTGAPGPQVEGSAGATGNAAPCGGAGKRPSSFPQSAAAAVHSFVDTAVGVGTTVSRAATVIGAEFLNMVHREQSGNTITLSKVEDPAGDAFQFRANTFNVSKLADISLSSAEFSNNSVNASKVSHLSLSRARFSQCQIAGSSITHVTLEGGPAPEPGAMVEAGGATPAYAAVRGVTFNATKFARVRLLGASQIDTCSFLGSAVKDIELGNGSMLEKSMFNDAAVSMIKLDSAAVTGLTIDRSPVHTLTLANVTLDTVGVHATRISETTLTGGTWKNVRFRRDALATGSGGRDSSLQESTFENCTLSDVNFLGCTFRRTTLRNIAASGLTIRNVDFTGLTLESEEAFRRAAGL